MNTFHSSQYFDSTEVIPETIFSSAAFLIFIKDLSIFRPNTYCVPGSRIESFFRKPYYRTRTSMIFVYTRFSRQTCRHFSNRSRWLLSIIENKNFNIYFEVGTGLEIDYSFLIPIFFSFSDK